MERLNKRKEGQPDIQGLEVQEKHCQGLEDQEKH